MKFIILTWTLVYAMQGWSPQPVQIDGFLTEQACKDAAHKFMDYYPKPKSWLDHEEGWFTKPSYIGIRCLDKGESK